MTKENLKTAGLVILTSILLMGYATDNTASNSKEAAPNMEITEHIRLYSNGQLIGEWEGIGRGQMNGDTYTFQTERGAFSNELRIKGDFIIERMNQ